MDLIHKLEKARTKDELEGLGIEHLSVDIDKRKTKDVLRAELIALAEEQGFAASEPEPAPESAPPEQPVAGGTPAPKGRMARNKKTGRVMPWTAAMAKYSHMEEV